MTEPIINDRIIENLVDAILTQALNSRASDIHLEPRKNDLLVRFRIDGLLRNVETIPKDYKGVIISRVKIMANLDIAEKRVPQDGRTTIKIGEKMGQDVDLRISTLPVMHGEKIVIRLLPQNQDALTLEQLGFNTWGIELYRNFLDKAQGLILITGPTGSGKTSTLYSSLLRVKDETLNIITVEDPIEYQLEDINQIQVHPKAGLTFASGLRSILRQDPDIIMVGEIRDAETANIVFQSALTGHLVFSTLHTNDTVSAVTRLIDMGVEPYLISSAVIGIIAQRLVRLVCNNCKEEYIPDKAILELLDLKQDREYKFVKSKGCANCFNTGYFGREGVFEILPVTEPIKELIHNRAKETEIRNKAKEEGLQTLKESAIEKLLQGLTTVDELVRVIML